MLMGKKPVNTHHNYSYLAEGSDARPRRGQEPEFHWPEQKQTEQSGHGESRNRGDLVPSSERPQKSQNAWRQCSKARKPHLAIYGALGRPAPTSQVCSWKGFCLGCRWQQGANATDLTGGKGTHASRRPGSCRLFRPGQFSPLGVSIGQETQEGPGVLTCHRAARDPEECDPRERLCHQIIAKYRHQAKCFPLIISLKSSERPYRVYAIISI